MCQIKYILTILVLFLFSTSSLIGQGILHNTYIVGGVALGEQDRRLFKFPQAERLLKRNPKKLDYDLILYVEKRVFKWSFLQINAGIGYAENNTSFGRPFAHSKLNGGNTYEQRYIKKYTINKLVLPFVTKVSLGKFYLRLCALTNINFRKSVLVNSYIPGKRFTKYKMEWNSLEINPGLGFNINSRLQIALSCRALYFNKVDDVIFNYALLRDQNHPFLQQKADTYNPFKMWLTVGYKLKK